MSSKPKTAEEVAAVAETYYDSDDADRFYFNIWGGEDIHVGIYEKTDDITTASRTTVSEMAKLSEPIGPDTTVLDIGAGYGGSARYLARAYGCKVNCLNISEVQNERNRQMNREQGLDHLITVVHGSFEDIPEPDNAFDVVWSQDAILHSGKKDVVFDEIDRVLKPGGVLVFTDPMQADEVPEGALDPVLARIHLDSMGSIGLYKKLAGERGIEEEKIVDLSQQLRNHYHRVREMLTERYDEMVNLSSKEYLDRMLVGLENWVKAADSGHLAWGILKFRKKS